MSSNCLRDNVTGHFFDFIQHVKKKKKKIGAALVEADLAGQEVPC